MVLFVSDMVGNPEDRFSRVAAHIYCNAPVVNNRCILTNSAASDQTARVSEVSIFEISIL